MTENLAFLQLPKKPEWPRFGGYEVFEPSTIQISFLPLPLGSRWLAETKMELVTIELISGYLENIKTVKSQQCQT